MSKQINDITLPEDLTEFLLARDIYTKFLIRATQGSSCKISSISAFSWRCTNEGHGYWNRLQDAYLNTRYL